MKCLLISLPLTFITFSEVLASPLSTRIEQIQIKDLPLISYLVTQYNATEKPFDNLYWNHHETGIYVDIIDGTPLFSSKDKYDSGTGWPTFARSIRKDSIIEEGDTTIGETRVSLSSRRSGAHLGHRFTDGPERYNGIRYCINSAALRFIPYNEMKAKGYLAFLRLFNQ